jgi:hypothetical protein
VETSAMHTFKVAKVSGSEPCFRVLAPDGIPRVCSSAIVFSDEQSQARHRRRAISVFIPLGPSSFICSRIPSSLSVMPLPATKTAPATNKIATQTKNNMLMTVGRSWFLLVFSRAQFHACQRYCLPIFWEIIKMPRRASPNQKTGSARRIPRQI